MSVVPWWSYPWGALSWLPGHRWAQLPEGVESLWVPPGQCCWWDRLHPEVPATPLGTVYPGCWLASPLPRNLTDVIVVERCLRLSLRQSPTASPSRSPNLPTFSLRRLGSRRGKPTSVREAIPATRVFPSSRVVLAAGHCAGDSDSVNYWYIFERQSETEGGSEKEREKERFSLCAGC